MRLPALVAAAAVAVLALSVLVAFGRPPAPAAALASGEPPDLAAVPTPEAPVFTIIDVAPYVVRGRTAEEILLSLRRRGPKADGAEFFGLTETQMAFTYNTVQGEAGCTLEGLRLDLHVAVTLPEWQDRARAPRTLAREWDRFERALRQHEDTHREIAERGAREAYHVLRSMRQPSCEGIDEAARELATRVRERNEARQHAYDRRTRHGRTEGAVWPQGARHHARR